MPAPDVEGLFAKAGCVGWLCVLDVAGDGEVRAGGDTPVAAASVYKVAIALEVFRQVAAGELDPRERIRVGPEDRTPGPTGFSLFADESEASVRDLAAMMLTISDNTATDLLAARAGLDRVAATLAELGLAGTVIPCTLREMLDAVGREAGLAGWAELAAAPDMGERLRGPLRAIHAIRTTPADMARLLRLIWRGEAGPEEACAAVRELMARQVTRQRMATGFPHDVRVAAKSGSLFGVVRNEIGVVRMPDGRRYAAAVFTRAERPYVNEHAINAAIGAAAAAAVQALRESADKN